MNLCSNPFYVHSRYLTLFTSYFTLSFTLGGVDGNHQIMLSSSQANSATNNVEVNSTTLPINVTKAEQPTSKYYIQKDKLTPELSSFKSVGSRQPGLKYCAVTPQICFFDGIQPSPTNIQDTDGNESRTCHICCDPNINTFVAHYTSGLKYHKACEECRKNIFTIADSSHFDYGKTVYYCVSCTQFGFLEHFLGEYYVVGSESGKHEKRSTIWSSCLKCRMKNKGQDTSSNRGTKPSQKTKSKSTDQASKIESSL